jgi:hypothetical protein
MFINLIEWPYFGIILESFMWEDGEFNKKKLKVTNAA